MIAIVLIAAIMVYGGRTQTLGLRPFLLLAIGALLYSYVLTLLFARPIGRETLVNAAIYYVAGLVSFLLGHLAINRFGRDRTKM
jgi:hypothetical protein